MLNNIPAVQPQRPTHFPTYAEACLKALAAEGLGDRISLGGAFGLLHYLDYRPTHDVDAWWVSSATTDDRERVACALEDALQAFGPVRRRVWGDVMSVELATGEKMVFSFQIASRDAQLRPSVQAPWGDVLLDSFPDLIASKMVALVERGAPRDFRDVNAVCQAGLAAPAECWRWWKERQRLAGSDTDADRACLAVETHLSRIAMHRPLDQIEDAAERSAAEQLRNWFATEFLHALMD